MCAKRSGKRQLKLMEKNKELDVFYELEMCVYVEGYVCVCVCLLTALQSVWYHLAPQAFMWQVCCPRGRSSEEHSYGGMTVWPSSVFIRHTTTLCWLPVPHSAEH